MKYTLVLLAAWLPLAALTVESFVEAARSPGRTTAVEGSLDVAAARQLATSAAKGVSGDEPLIEKLQSTDLFELSSDTLPDAQSEPLRRVTNAWRDSQLARTLVTKYRPIGELLAQPDPEVREDLERRYATLDDFLKNERPKFNDKVRGSGPLFEQVQQRASRINHRIDCLRWLEGVRLSVQQSERELEGGNYQACLERIDSQQASQPPAAELRGQVESESARLAELRKIAEYRWDYQKLEAACLQAGLPLAERAPRGKANSQVRRLLEAFLQKHPEAPGGDSARQTRVNQRRVELELEAALVDLESQPDIVRLVHDGAQLVRTAQKVLTDQTDRRVTVERVREIARNRLRSQEALPIMDDTPEDLLGKQEAVSNAGQRFIGVFYLPAGTTQYRFWRDQQGRQLRPRGDEQLAVNTLAQQPSTPRYVAWAQEYNGRVQDLLQRGGSVEDWEQFAQWCEETQSALERYRQRWGLKEPYDRNRIPWSFRGPAAVARKITANREDFQDVLGR